MRFPRIPSTVLAAAFGLVTLPLTAQFPGLNLGGPELNPPGVTNPEQLPPPNAPPAAPAQVVTEVEIRGLYMTKEYEAQKYLKTRRDREFDPQMLQADVRRLVTSGLFADVKTFTRQVPGGIVVVFEVLERPRIRYIRFLGNRGLSDRSLLKESGLKEGEAINAFATEEARRKLEDLYHRKGYPKAEAVIIEGNQTTDKGVAFQINEGPLERISSVIFEGNEIASDERLKTQIESKPGIMYYFLRGKIDRSKLDSDVEKLTAYYRSLGFFRAKIGRELVYDESGSWAKVKFVIDEGPRYIVRNVTLEGNDKFYTEPVLEFLSTKKGQFFDQGRMNKDVNTLLDLYGSQGHVFADVQADPRFLEEPGQLDLIYRIKEGDVFSVSKVNVKIQGEAPHTRESVVLNRLSLRPGDIIDIREIRNSERRLKASQLFETNPQVGDPPRIVIRPPEFDAELAALEISQAAVRGQDPDAPRPAQPPEQVRLRTGSTQYSWQGAAPAAPVETVYRRPAH